MQSRTEPDEFAPVSANAKLNWAEVNLISHAIRSFSPQSLRNAEVIVRLAHEASEDAGQCQRLRDLHRNLRAIHLYTRGFGAAESRSLADQSITTADLKPVEVRSAGESTADVEMLRHSARESLQALQ